MPTRIPALVNPLMLAWAREEAGYSLDKAAENTGFSTAKLREWEGGQTQPTIRQAEKLAKAYHRPYSIFCLQHPPSIAPLAAEYRRLPGITPGKESPELRLAIRQMQHRRSGAIRLLGELGESPDTFSIQVRLNEDPERVGTRLRSLLGISISEQNNWPHEFRAWPMWREAVERLGVLVSQFYKVQPDEVRGVCLLDFPLPIIGINNKEIPASKPFTLLHEFVHLALAFAQEEKPALEERRGTHEWAKVERYAEEVTGAILLPQSALDGESIIINRHPNSHWTVDEIKRLARKYKVTPLALATRLLRIGRMSPKAYNQWKSNWNDYLEEHPPKSGGGIASPAEKALNRNGETFCRLVLEALTQDRITSLEAARYLELNYPHVETLRRDLSLAQPLRAAEGE